MKYFFKITILFLLFFQLTLVKGQDFGTEEEARSMLERAVNLVNYDKSFALNVFTERTGGFNYKDLYPFCADDAGMLTGHPFNIGLDLLTFIDSDGKNVGEEFLKVAEVGVIKKVTYKITYPKDANIQENKEYVKIALVTRVSDQICAVGYHQK